MPRIGCLSENLTLGEIHERVKRKRKEPDIRSIGIAHYNPMTEQALMRLSRESVQSATHAIPKIQFEDQEMTSFSGLAILFAMFQQLGLRQRFDKCTRHLRSSNAYSAGKILMLLVAHSFLGWRRLRDLDYYRDDPLLLRLIGVRSLPDVSTISRRLPQMDERVVNNQRRMIREMAEKRILEHTPARTTLDFDGSVLSTKSRQTEGTAIGYNKNKGQRGYYPLLATVAQTGQVYDIQHRAGNVHDSNGAVKFARECIENLRDSGFRGVLEMRMDGAHFSENAMAQLCRFGVEFSVSVPFARFPDAKARVLARKTWHRIDDEWSYFDLDWAPKSWDRRLRCVVYRRKVRVPRKGPIQLDLFEPIDRRYEFKVVMTNKAVSAASLLAFHNGRGAQEAIFAQLKSQGSFDYIPTRREIGNRVYALSCILAHNLGREMQMAADAPDRCTANPTRAPLWVFKCMRTIRMAVIQRAGRLTRPKGIWTLTMAVNDRLQQEFTRLLAPWGRRRAG